MNKLIQGATPYYLQIEAILRDQIASGDLRPGDLVPTEKTLCDQYGVSRPTVRQAIKNLEIDGLLVRQRGKGTRIIERPEDKISPLIDLQLADLLSITKADDIVLARTGNCISPPAVRAEFDFDKPQEVFSFVRVYLADGIPVMTSKSFLPIETAKLLNEKDFVAKNFLQILSHKLGKKIAQCDQQIDAILAEPSMADFLEVSPGTPLLSVRMTARDQNSLAAIHCHTLIRTDQGKLNVSMGWNDDQQKWQMR